jgi:DNA polymerase-3 subunit gamma/tau
MLGVADPRAISRLITSIAESNNSAALHLIYDLSEAGADLRQINTQMVEYWRALMLANAGADVAAILDLTEDEAHEVKQLTQLFALEELTECARIFAQNDLIQKNQGTPQLALELASLECIEVHHRMQSSQQVAAVHAHPSISRPTTQAETPGRLEARLHQPSPQVQRRQEGSGTTVTPIGEKEEIRTSQAQGDGNKPALTVQQVRSVWENVIKRTRQKSSGTLAAMLRLYNILDVEGSAEQPIVVIQSEKQAHYKYVKEEDRYKILEWALTIEFGLECRVRLVPPGQSVPLPPVSDPISYSSSAAPAIAPQQSAYLERPVSPSYLSEEISDAQKPLSRMSQSLYEISPSDENSLARTGSVKENISVVQPQETIEQKVRRDPVVQEVIKTFTARIVDVRPK